MEMDCYIHDHVTLSTVSEKKLQLSDAPHCDLTSKISYFKDAMKKLLLSKQNEGKKIK